MTAAETGIGAVVLAAGASARMGAPKQLLEVEGIPLVARAADALLEALVWPVVVVVGSNARQVRAALARRPVLTVENPAWAEGMGSSIRTGIYSLQRFSRAIDGAVVALCDQPALSAEAVRRLIAARRETGRSIAAARYRQRNGAPALFMREHFAALATLTGDEGARELLNGRPERVAAVELPELGWDLDTPEDYEAWRKDGR